MQTYRLTSITRRFNVLAIAGFALIGLLMPQSHGFAAPITVGAADVGSAKHEVPPDQRRVPEHLFPTITSVNLDGPPVIEFQVSDELGLPVTGFRQGDNVSISFTVSKLAPGSRGETSRWRTYIRGSDEGVAGAQATTYSGGKLEDLGGGNYRFTFDKALPDISGVAFRSDLTHRVGMEIRDPVILGEEVPGEDAVFDIQPSTGNTSGIEQRKIVKQESCANCHGTEEFAFHGGPRQSVDYCVTCHQPGSRDVGSGNTMDFRVMIHKIHFGENLTNLPYTFCGFGCENFGAPPDDFSHVAFPQDIRNCTNCHDPEDPETPQAVNVNNRATAAACTSCHDDLASDYNGLTNANGNHPALAQPNENCVECHSEGGLVASILKSHEIPSQQAAKRFSYNILNVTNSGPGQSPVITFSVTDPTNGDASYDLENDPEFTGSGARLAMAISWPNNDFTNVSNDAGTSTTGRPVGQAISISVAGGDLPAGVTSNGDGTYTVNTGMLSTPLVVPSTTPALGSGTVILEGHPAGDFNSDGSFDDSVPATSAAKAFAITDSSPRARRAVVDVANCQNCHGVNDGLSLHGGNRTDNVLVCSTCHNPNATDLFRRPIDPDGTADGMNMATLDGLEDRPIDFKHLIHAIHGSSHRETPYVVYGFGSTPHDFSHVGYPRSPSDCHACHREGTESLPLGANVLGTTVNSGATVVGASFFGANAYAPSMTAALDPTDDNNASPTAAVCSACHDSNLALEHMSVRSTSEISFGNSFLLNPDPIVDPDTQARLDMAGAENCGFCHGPGGIADIAEFHGAGE